MRDRSYAGDVAWARVAGILYLFTNLVAVFGFVVRGRIIARGDAVQTAHNILDSGRLFRAGMVAELICVAGTIALAVALYGILRTVNRNLALLALLWRMVENIVLAVVTLAECATLTFVEGGRYLNALSPMQQQSLAYAPLRIYSAGFNVGFLFLGLGSALFSYLWWRSGYMPKLIAGWGIFASLFMAVSMLVIIVVPELTQTLSMGYLPAMGIYEIGLGAWLLVKGIRLPPATAAR